MTSSLTRRALLSAIAAGAAGALPTLAQSQSDGEAPSVALPRVWVTTEWGPLRSVIVGRGDGARFPLTPMATMDAVLETQRDTSEVPPELEDRLIGQLDGLANLLQERGISVFRPTPLTDAEKQYLNYLEDGGGLIFMRDPMLAVANQVIELSLRPIYRRKEIFSLRALLSQLHERGLAGYFAMPTPAPQGERQFLEGGDVLLAGRDVLVGVSGKASDLAGVHWLRRNLGPAYRVHSVRLRPDILHLDLAIALVRPGLAIIDPGALTGDLPAFLRGWDLITLMPEEAEALAANVLVIDPRTVVVEANQTRLMRELARRGVTPLALPFDAPIMMEGGFRCATHPLQRAA